MKCCSQMDFKGTHNNGKDLLTNRKDSWAESKDLKGLLLKNPFPRTYLKGLWEPLDRIPNIVGTSQAQITLKTVSVPSASLGILSPLPASGCRNPTQFATPSTPSMPRMHPSIPLCAFPTALTAQHIALLYLLSHFATPF